MITDEKLALFNNLIVRYKWGEFRFLIMLMVVPYQAGVFLVPKKLAAPLEVPFCPVAPTIVNETQF